MKFTRRFLRKVILEAVRQDILDSISGKREKRITLINRKLDPELLQNIRQPRMGESQKPRGLWYGFGTDWIEFTREPHNAGLLDYYVKPEYLYELEIDTTTIDNPNPNKVLSLQTNEDFNKLSEKYEVASMMRITIADWYSISKDFGGIEVSDSVVHSFGTWDISSGCIWNKNVIKKVTTLQDPNTTENIPRGSAALGINLGYNPKAQTINEINSEPLKDLIKNAEEELDGTWGIFPGISEYLIDEYQGKDFWHKLVNIFKFDMSQENRGENWIYHALKKKRFHKSDNYVFDLKAVLWIILHYNENKDALEDFTRSLHYTGDLPIDKIDMMWDMLKDFNLYLQDISDEYELGIKNIDLEKLGEWDKLFGTFDS